ncbi:hypothetical protein IVA80_23235 [Bradyrhizobium sp. 139]|uniref:hypothetical protein n=1 Tax=Bradyrhizobium sp. 139 TaxID=2782616 RepID=UPI001FF75C28|nr:hypothetical protein [Bradyrhizobium sp. 139]MCK1743681.1 hypothetical protein [Bradyrhizobium sp. 139]
MFMSVEFMSVEPVPLVEPVVLDPRLSDLAVPLLMLLDPGLPVVPVELEPDMPVAPPAPPPAPPPP